MKEMTKAELEKMAMRSGARLVTGDRVFNSAGARASAPARKPAPVIAAAAVPVAPAAPPEPTVNMSEVQRMLDERDTAWRAQFDLLRQVFTESLSAMQAQPTEPAAPVAPVTWQFDVKYNEDGSIRGISASPRKGA